MADNHSTNNTYIQYLIVNVWILLLPTFWTHVVDPTVKLQLGRNPFSRFVNILSIKSQTSRGPVCDLNKFMYGKKDLKGFASRSKCTIWTKKKSILENSSSLKNIS